jgi:hypothetical protein
MRSKDYANRSRLVNVANYSPVLSSNSEFNPAIFIIYLKKLVCIKIFCLFGVTIINPRRRHYVDVVNS